MTNQLMLTVQEKFRQIFDADPAFTVRAPGRVNLIGEHTDYNDGFVLPMAIDRAVWIALRPRDDDRVVVHSVDFDETASFPLTSLQKGKGWLEYIKGMAFMLQEAGYALRGWDGVMAGDVPVGAGLSSSAALEMAAAQAFTAVTPLSWDGVQMAKLGQRCENEWLGLQTGIMDQMISANGQADHALLIDCRSLEIQAVPLPAGVAVVILDTATRRGLVDSAYNERRQQCETAAQFFGVSALRDVNLVAFEAQAGQLDDLTRRRARHVISENERTLQAAAAMRQGDAVALGKLMDASHVSLRDDFAVSSEALNTIVEIARQQPGCFGARMTGAGFGGCAVALVEQDKAAGVATAVATQYESTTGNKPNIYICQATNGAAIVR